MEPECLDLLSALLFASSLELLSLIQLMPAPTLSLKQPSVPPGTLFYIFYTLARHPFLLLDVYEPLCNPCQRMEAAIYELSVELKDQAALGMMDGTNNPLIEERYNVTGYPTLLVFENGTLIDTRKGFASKKYIVDSLRIAKKRAGYKPRYL